MNLLLLLPLLVYVKGQEECLASPCQNGGSVTTYTCVCANGYSGTNCELAPPTETPWFGDTTNIPTLPPCEFPVPVSDVAQGKSTDQSSTNTRKNGNAEKAVDGNTNGNMVQGKSCTQTLNEFEPYWTVDLGQRYEVYEVVIYTRQDCCTGRIKTGIVRLGNYPEFKSNPQCGREIVGRLARVNPIRVRCGCPVPMKGRYVSIQLTEVSRPMNLCEVEVMAG